ncbi:MAG: PD-(D/E)XK nuclease family protein, partial [Alistipes sp.]|nr:PD-(D/E)XK nuclease family protein [Alistipes sp.]
KEQLHILFPVSRPDKSGNFDPEAENVGELLFNIFSMAEQYSDTADSESVPEPIVCTFGTDEGAVASERVEQKTIVLNESPLSEYKMRLKLSSRRVIEAIQGKATTARDEGILLHEVMERAESVEDITRAVEQLVIDGFISQKRAEEITAQVEKIFENATVREWFGSSWQSVRNECDIIAPGVGIKRPDRVMIDGERAVVVDYKFGERSNTYHKQIALYCTLLEQMGYKTEGYLWYVREGDIERVV